MKMKKVFVVGAGFMGSGIAQVCAQSGMTVVLNDISQEAIDTGLKNITWSVSRFIEKGKLTEDKETILNRISTALDFSNGSDADVAIEAVFENVELNDLTPSWLIIGSCTGPKAKQPKKHWVESLTTQGRKCGAAIFYKPNLVHKNPPREFPGKRIQGELF